MITLRDMNEEEFESYRSLFINEYAQDLQKIGNISLKKHEPKP